jgi:hypothetical protein
MKQYGISFIELSWQDLDFKPGLAAGSTIAEARNVPRYTYKVLANGSAVRNESSDRTGVLTVLVDQQSQLHQDLLGLSQDDRENKDVVGDMVMKNTQTGQKTTYRNACIVTEPDESQEAESADFTWTFFFEDIIREPVDVNRHIERAQGVGVALGTLGISLASIKGADAQTQLGIIGDALNKVEDQGMRARLTAQLFGEEAAPAIAPLLAQGSSGINKLAGDARVLSERQADAMAILKSVFNFVRELRHRD